MDAYPFFIVLVDSDPGAQKGMDHGSILKLFNAAFCKNCVIIQDFCFIFHQFETVRKTSIHHRKKR
jgi:hypothetical protein